MSASKWKPYTINKQLKLGSVEEIPSNWDLVKIKHVVNNLVSGGTPDSGNDDFWSDDDTGIPWVSISDMSTVDFVDTTVKRITNLGLEAKRLPILRKGTIIYSIYASIGKVSVLDIDATVNQAILGLNGLVETDTDFLVYWLKHLEESISLYSSSNTQLNLNANIVGNLPVLRPPLMEQKVISKFLNKKTLDISNSINYFETQLDLLKEKRSALITQAVTKGLNPNVSMKDSGIDWIGEIPEHWNTRKVKHLFQLMNEPSIASHGMELLSVYTAIGVRPRKSLEQKGNKATSTDGYWLVQKEDLVVNKLLAWMGAIGRSEYDGVTSPAYDILRPLGNTVTEYYHFLFRCGICLPEFKKRSRGIMEMRLRLYFEELGSIEVPCPPPEEQQEIADYIRNLDDTQIDLETGINKQIEKLGEYRTALISAAVTGKIDVRGQA